MAIVGVGLTSGFDGRLASFSVARLMKALWRALLALGITGAIAGVLRFRGTGGIPLQKSGWRELSGPEFR